MTENTANLPNLTKQEKDLLESKTFWGAIISGVGYGLSHFGIAIDSVLWTDTAIEFAGIAITIYGRYKAGVPITSVFGLTLKKFADAEIASLKRNNLKDRAKPVAGSTTGSTTQPQDNTHD